VSLTVKPPTLYIFSGLPASGKSTLARMLAAHVGAAYLRIDTIEQALRDLCAFDVQGEGYRLAYRIAADNLTSGLSVVADSCNPLELTRREWEQVASDAGARSVNIEIICSDVREHRHRVETRTSTIEGLRLPTWTEVEGRVYDPWSSDRIVVDTAGRSEAECLAEITSRAGILPRVSSLSAHDP
jgi:predicted kinase